MNATPIRSTFVGRVLKELTALRKEEKAAIGFKDGTSNWVKD